jgi:hypothetical protein
MKLRFEKNAIRLRLRKSDLTQLKENGFVKETVEFPGFIFTYQLNISLSDTLNVQFIDHAIMINIPSDIAGNWINTTEVGIYQTLQFNNKKTLDVIIEKDFPCKEKHDENKDDTFTELAGGKRNMLIPAN